MEYLSIFSTHLPQFFFFKLLLHKDEESDEGLNSPNVKFFNIFLNMVTFILIGIPSNNLCYIFPQMTNYKMYPQL